MSKIDEVSSSKEWDQDDMLDIDMRGELRKSRTLNDRKKTPRPKGIYVVSPAKDEKLKKSRTSVSKSKSKSKSPQKRSGSKTKAQRTSKKAKNE